VNLLAKNVRRPLANIPWSQRSPEARARQIEKVLERRKELRKWYDGLKDRPCTDCGGSFHPAAMHWDHLPGFEKVANLSRLKHLGSKRKILEEIKKCELVCANCHAVRTFERSFDS
jgi:hypothetical protein